MSAFVHDAALSRSERLAPVLEEFALVGYAQLMLVLETLANPHFKGAMAWDAWAAQLHADVDATREFLTFCADEGVLDVADAGAEVTVACAWLERPGASDPAVINPADTTLYATPEQWAAWFVSDLSYPPARANSADSRRFFARWCASRVTVGDMTAAVNACIDDGSGLGLPNLHKKLHALAVARLKEASECY